MQYEWTDHKLDATGDAQRIGERLAQLRKTCKAPALTAAVVADARSEDSPLHPFFDWNDYTAAEKYRRSQAKDLIRAVVVVKGEGTQRAARAVVVAAPRAESDDALRVGVANPEDRARLVDQAKDELRTFRARWAGYAELASVLAAIDQLLAPQAVSTQTRQRICSCGAITNTNPCHSCRQVWKRAVA